MESKKMRFCSVTKTKEESPVGDSFSNAMEMNNEVVGTKTFPQKLMDILFNDEHSYIVSWLPEGDGFRIHDTQRFIVEVLPRYFKACKFTSFTRKLNRWGFLKGAKNHGSNVYHHSLFRRDNPELCRQMGSYSPERKFTSMFAGKRHLLPSTTQRPNLTSNYQLNLQQQQQLMLHQQMEFYQMQQLQFLQMQQNPALLPHFGPTSYTQMAYLPSSSPVSGQPQKTDETGAPVVSAMGSHSISREEKKEDTRDSVNSDALK